jgi:hypothetical protein
VSADLPPTPETLSRHIVITVERTSASPWDVDVSVDGGDLDVIALKAYIEVALVQLEAVDVEDED